MIEIQGQSNTSSVGVSSGKVSSINDEIILIYTWVVYGVLCLLISIFGFATNIINIICFIKQGFKDSVNISLLGLSVSDLGCLATLSVTNIFFTPAVRTADLAFEPLEVNYLITAMPHLSFSRVTSWITALITLERCLCIIAPLKIKRIITPRRTTFITIIVFISLFFSVAPVYVVNRLAMRFSPERNKTIFGLVYTNDREQVDTITFTINNFILPFTAFLIIVVCTITLVYKLKNSTEWRNKYMKQSQVDNVSNRNQKVAKMVVMISTLFIVCFVPITIIMLALAFEPELSFNGKHLNVMIILGGIGFVLEAINSSSNIFIYYHMSSKYRIHCRQIFCEINRKSQ